MKKVLKWLGYGLLLFTVVGIIAVATDSPADAAAKQGSGTPANVSYKVFSKQADGRHLEYRLIIEERADKATLIEIVRKLKEETGWKDELVTFFHIGAYSSSHAWAGVDYLPHCESCATDKDADGNPIRCEIMGVNKAYADSLRALNLDTLENKQLLASYIEDSWKCKTQLFAVAGKPGKLLMAQLSLSGNSLLQWLSLKEYDGEQRYYFDGKYLGPKNYIVIDKAGKYVHYKDPEDKPWQSFKYE